MVSQNKQLLLEIHDQTEVWTYMQLFNYATE